MTGPRWTKPPSWPEEWQAVPMRRFGTAEEVATLVLFLLPDDSAYMTGAELAIDDGASL